MPTIESPPTTRYFLVIQRVTPGEGMVSRSWCIPPELAEQIESQFPPPVNEAMFNEEWIGEMLEAAFETPGMVGHGAGFEEEEVER